MRDKLGSPLGRRLFLGLLVILVMVSAGYGLFVSRTTAAPQQPIPFNHQLMVQAGMQCLYCHSAALKSPAAGIPSMELCMGCHTVIATDRPGVQQLTDYWKRQEPIPWVRIYRLPRFAFFAHNVHIVAGGLNCERCHGDVGNMTEVYPVVTMGMGWCLSCHNQQPNADWLRDCSVCHR